MLTFTGKLKSNISQQQLTFCYTLVSLENPLKATDSIPRIYIYSQFSYSFRNFMDFCEAYPYISFFDYAYFKHFYPPKIYCCAYYVFTLTDCIEMFNKSVFMICGPQELYSVPTLLLQLNLTAVLGNRFIRGKHGISKLEVGKMNNLKIILNVKITFLSNSRRHYNELQ